MTDCIDHLIIMLETANINIRILLKMTILATIFLGFILAAIVGFYYGCSYLQDQPYSEYVRSQLNDDGDEEFETGVEPICSTDEDDELSMRPRKVKRKRDTYVKDMVERMRSIYGTSSGKPAQNRALRDAMNALMDGDNVHYHQRNAIISRVLVLLAIPSDSEIYALKIAKSREARKRNAYKQPC
jgi:hypothetical protein